MMMYYGGLGQTPPVKHAFTRVGGQDLPIETRRACGAAVQARQYPNMTACYDAVRAGAPVPAVDAPLTVPPAEEATSTMRLYVGIGIAVLVVGIGAYLIVK